MSDDDLILPPRLARQRAQERRNGATEHHIIDDADLALAQQLLRLLKKGYEENQWPRAAMGYAEAGLEPDVCLAYHVLSAARVRGYRLGVRAAEAGSGHSGGPSGPAPGT